MATTFFTSLGVYYRCPHCGSPLLEREHRDWWMRTIPLSKKFHCRGCQRASLAVLGRILPLKPGALKPATVCEDLSPGDPKRVAPRSLRAITAAPSPHGDSSRGVTADAALQDIGLPARYLTLIQQRPASIDWPSLQTFAALADSFTVAHEARVADLASALAIEMGLPSESIALLRDVALVQDLGNVWIPAEILNKPGKLMPAQFEMIKLHPQLGYELLELVKSPRALGEIVLQHHERIDGSGYPHGLSGDAIRIEARILAVADVLAAMTSPRPYRASLGMNAALQELERGRGTLYDQTVVDACLRLYGEGKNQLLSAA